MRDRQESPPDVPLVVATPRHDIGKLGIGKQFPMELFNVPPKFRQAEAFLRRRSRDLVV
jgi:hypothetical protein